MLNYIKQICVTAHSIITYCSLICNNKKAILPIENWMKLNSF